MSLNSKNNQLDYIIEAINNTLILSDDNDADETELRSKINEFNTKSFGQLNYHPMDEKEKTKIVLNLSLNEIFKHTKYQNKLRVYFQDDLELVSSKEVYKFYHPSVGFLAIYFPSEINVKERMIITDKIMDAIATI